MKKVYLTLCFAALALVSCVKTQNVYTGSPESREIAFSPLAQNATKAAFPTTESFYLAAYVAGDPGYDYFDKTEFTYDSGSSTWKGNRFWPVDEVTLNFLAVTKQGGTPTVTFGSAGVNHASQVVVALSDNSTAQHDLMFAYNRSATKNAPVSLAFNHALSWVYFTAHSNIGSAITVTGITLNGAKYSGTATIALSNYSSPSETLSHTLTWAPSNSGENVAVPGISSQVLTTSAANCGNGLMVVPNPSEAAFTSFTVYYTLNGHAYSQTVTPETRTLAAGYKYIYDINITLTEITVTATMSDWGNPNA